MESPTSYGCIDSYISIVGLPWYSGKESVTVEGKRNTGSIPESIRGPWRRK